MDFDLGGLPSPQAPCSHCPPCSCPPLSRTGTLHGRLEAMATKKKTLPQSLESSNRHNEKLEGGLLDTAVLSTRWEKTRVCTEKTAHQKNPMRCDRHLRRWAMRHENHHLRITT